MIKESIFDSGVFVRRGRFYYPYLREYWQDGWLWMMFFWRPAVRCRAQSHREASLKGRKQSNSRDLVSMKNGQKSRVQKRNPAYQKLAQLGDIPGSIAGVSGDRQDKQFSRKHPCCIQPQLGVDNFQGPQVRLSDTHQQQGFLTKDDSSDQHPGS